MAEPNWIDHDGSDECPVSAGVNVVVRMRDAGVSNPPHPGDQMFWGTHADDHLKRYDIVAYYLAT